MQGEFREILGDKRHHPGVVWSRGDFAEDHLVAAYEQLHAKQTITSQRQHHLAGDGLGTLEGQVAHLLRLPGTHGNRRLPDDGQPERRNARHRQR